MIKIDFEIKHEKYGTYRDAIYLPENHGLSEVEIENMKQSRFTNWVSAIEAPAQEETAVEDYIEIDGVKYKKVAE